jgi:hypothetical protein
MEEVANVVVASQKQWFNEIKNLIFCMSQYVMFYILCYQLMM